MAADEMGNIRFMNLGWATGWGERVSTHAEQLMQED
jgi:hypothetical protein